MKAELIENNLSGNDSTVFTLKEIRKIINQFRINPDIRMLYSKILMGIDGRESLKLIETIYKFVSDNIRYQKDINEIETLQTPLRTMQLGFGDCDDFTILLGTLYEGAGMKTRIVLVSQRPDKMFHHVFIQVFDGQEWITADPVEKYLGRGFKEVSNVYIEGKGEGMAKMLLLSGTEKQENQTYRKIDWNSKKRKTIINQSNHQLNGFYPVLMGNDLGLFGIKIKLPNLNPMTAINAAVNAAKSAVSSAYNAAKSAAESAYNTAKSAANTVAKYAQNPLEIVNDVKNTVEAVAKNTINAAIHVDISSLSKTLSMVYPPAGMLTTALEIIKDPSKLADPKNLANIAISAAIPESMKAYASLAQKAITDPKSLLDPNALINLAAGYAIPAETLQKLKNTANLITDPKSLINESLKILNADVIKDLPIKTFTDMKKNLPSLNLPSQAKQIFSQADSIISGINSQIQNISKEIEDISNEVNEFNSQINDLMRKNGQIYFDMNFYFSNNPGLEKALMDWKDWPFSGATIQEKAFNHFIQYGIKEGRLFSPIFIAKNYLDANPGLEKALMDWKDWPFSGATIQEKAVKHYIDYGAKEGRPISPKHAEIKQKEAAINQSIAKIDALKTQIGEQVSNINKQIQVSASQQPLSSVPGQKSNAEIQAALQSDWGAISQVYSQIKNEIDKI